MKRNVKFFTIVISLILLSSVILAGCMYGIITDDGEMKDYDMNGENSDIFGDIISEDAPFPQDLLRAKFKAMYDVSEDGKTITVISQDYLSKYWQSNYEKEVIKSLTTEEVYFIIQDSIRIYEEYDEVVLTAFASYSSLSYVSARFPFVNGKSIDTRSASKDSEYYVYFEEDIANIYAIIMYRLTALSSPEAFFTGADAIRHVGGDPLLCSNMYPETLFYIPGYSEDTDRDHILSVMGKGRSSTDEETFELFVIPYTRSWGRPVIEFLSKNGGTTKAYPTVEMEKQVYNVYYVAPEGAFFRLDRDGKFYLFKHLSLSSALTGEYRLKGDVLTLIVSEEEQYVFHYFENEGYLYSKEYSTPSQGYDFAESTMFYFREK